MSVVTHIFFIRQVSLQPRNLPKIKATVTIFWFPTWSKYANTCIYKVLPSPVVREHHKIKP